jgi:uncharacterized protein
MAEQTSQEPTMEEILASIRRIISEDETPEAEAKDAAPPAAAEPSLTAAFAPDAAPPPGPTPLRAPGAGPVWAAAEDEEDDTLELTEKVASHGDLDADPPSEPPPAPRLVAAEPAPSPSLVSETAAAAAASAFGKLSAVVAMPADGRTLEDVVRELLRPPLQQWLDDHLPAIVQEAVQTEVERIARGRVR